MARRVCTAEKKSSSITSLRMEARRLCKSPTPKWCAQAKGLNNVWLSQPHLGHGRQNPKAVVLRHSMEQPFQWNLRGVTTLAMWPLLWPSVRILGCLGSSHNAR